MKINFERRDFFPLACLVLFLGMNILGAILFPYEIIIPEVPDNELHYTIGQSIVLISTIPIVLFFVSLGYIAGVAVREKSTEKIA